jgi:hypothetical protein
MKKLILIIIFVMAMAAPALVFAQSSGGPCLPNSPSSTLCNPLIGTADDIPSFFGYMFTWLATVLGLLAMVVIIFSGAQMIFSQGNSATVSKAKSGIAYSLIGLVTIMFGYAIISATRFFIKGQVIDPNNPSRRFFENPLGSGDLKAFVISTTQGFLGLVGVITILYIIINAFKFVTARGNEEQAKSARTGITWAIVGLITVILSYVIVVTLVNTIS